MRLPEYLLSLKRQRRKTDAEVVRLEEQLAQMSVPSPSAEDFLEGVWAKIDQKVDAPEWTRRPYVLRPALTGIVVASLGLIGLLLYLPLLRFHSMVQIDPSSDPSVRISPPIPPSVKNSQIDLAALFPDLWMPPAEQTPGSERQPEEHKGHRSVRSHRPRRSRNIQLASEGRRQRHDLGRTGAALAWKQVSGLGRDLSVHLYPDVGVMRVAWQRQAARLEMEGRYEEASTAYGCAFRLRQEPGIAFAAGRTAEAAGNIESAVAYYAHLLN